VKGIQFGAGFRFANMTGSEANDPFRVVDGKIVTLTNNNGGVNGGITNGMPVVFSTVIKPTPSIGRLQETVNFETMENVELEIKGRHDPAIIHRARAVVDALTALVIADLICIEKGTGWLA
jgi:chorismate synthase